MREREKDKHNIYEDLKLFYTTLPKRICNHIVKLISRELILQSKCGASSVHNTFMALKKIKNPYIYIFLRIQLYGIA